MFDFVFCCLQCIDNPPGGRYHVSDWIQQVLRKVLIMTMTNKLQKVMCSIQKGVINVSADVAILIGAMLAALVAEISSVRVIFVVI